MGKLCIADIDRWDTGAIATVFGISTNIADYSLTTSGHLGNLSVFETWNSDASDAARESVGKTRKDLDRHSEIAKKVGDAARKAEQEVQEVKNALRKLRADIAAAGFVLDPHTDVISDPHPERTECMTDEAAQEYVATLERLNFELATVLTAAACADHDLATAIKNADGEWNIVQWKPSTADVLMGSAGPSRAPRPTSSRRSGAHRWGSIQPVSTRRSRRGWKKSASSRYLGWVEPSEY